MATRDYSDPAYTRFRKAVRERDGGACILCKSKKQVHVHHIVRYSDSPLLRCCVSNGCCLCKKCHTKVTGAELFYQELLSKIVRRKMLGNG